jgi:phage terminase large subunit-like protein
MQGFDGSQFDKACPELAEGLTVTSLTMTTIFVILSPSKGCRREG